MGFDIPIATQDTPANESTSNPIDPRLLDFNNLPLAFPEANTFETGPSLQQTEEEEMDHPQQAFLSSRPAKLAFDNLALLDKLVDEAVKGEGHASQLSAQPHQSTYPDPNLVANALKDEYWDGWIFDGFGFEIGE